MNFRSIDDMVHAIRRNLYRIPRDIDVVVGIPRSGLLPASMIALHRNIILTDVEGLLAGRFYMPGSTREKPGLQLDPRSWKKILLVDDSLATGASIKEAAAALGASGDWEILTCAIFGTSETRHLADFVFDLCPRPRIFEWNMMHHHRLSEACIDFDGVLCVDPTEQQNDDGPLYQAFLRDVPPLLIPSRPVGAIVSSRLEKYRPLVEDWLHRHNIEYGELHLLDLPSAAERQRLRPHASFKASVYRSNPKYRIFIESEPKQAGKIAHESGKPVICTENMTYYPGGFVNLLKTKVSTRRSIRRRIKSALQIEKFLGKGN